MRHRGYVLVSAEWGVFLGEALGFRFWSRADPVGQDSAPTWPSEEFAACFETVLDDVTALAVETLDPDYASVAEVVAAGGPEWDPSAPGLTEAEGFQVIEPEEPE